MSETIQTENKIEHYIASNCYLMDGEGGNVVLITGKRDDKPQIGIMATLDELEKALVDIKKSVPSNIIVP